MRTSIFSMMVLALSVNTAMADTDLNAQLEDLKLPGNVAPAGITSEKLYSVQNRFATLGKRMEFNLGVGQNFTGNGMIRMRQLNGSIAYHLTDRWSVSASGSFGFNDFTKTAELLMMNDGIVPDAAIVKWRADVLANFNLFYGKFRTSIDQVFYFDQYVSAGPGLVNTQYGTTPAAVADVGIALWIGKNWSTRFGVKNDFFREKTQLSNDLAYHMLGHIEVGYLIGGDERAYE